MTIKDAEKLTGLTIKSIRYYEKKGLISIGRNEDNDYRNYTEEDIERLKLIKVLRYIDCSTDEISSILKNNDLTKSLKIKSKKLEEESNNYLEKQAICNALIKDNKKKNFKTLIDDYSESINFLETDEVKELKFSFIDALCPSLSSLIIQSLIFLGPILWLFVNIHNQKWNSLILSSILAIIATIFLSSEWIYYFIYKKNHKETSKDKNRKNILTIPILIISIIIVTFLYILLNMGVELLLSPKDYLFYETSIIPSKLMILVLVILLLTITSLILKKFNINKSEDIEIYTDLWKKGKYILIIIVITITYCFCTSVTFITEDKIIIHDPIHPLGISYNYEDITKIETGFGTKNFSILDYNRKGEFYYRIYINNRKITFYTTYPNPNIKKYEDDTYLELEEFDNNLMKYNIEKITNDKYASACNLDKQYCNRFLRIINNK